MPEHFNTSFMQSLPNAIFKKTLLTLNFLASCQALVYRLSLSNESLSKSRSYQIVKEFLKDLKWRSPFLKSKKNIFTQSNYTH
jgi:hypothetical protein